MGYLRQVCPKWEGRLGDGNTFFLSLDLPDPGQASDIQTLTPGFQGDSGKAGMSPEALVLTPWPQFPKDPVFRVINTKTALGRETPGFKAIYNELKVPKKPSLHGPG